MIYAENVLSIHCKRSFDRLSSMGEIDDLGLFFSGLCVPGLTPRFYWIGADLQTSENMTFLAICRM